MVTPPFRCMTVISFSEMAKLKGRDNTIGMNGNKWIFIISIETISKILVHSTTKITHQSAVVTDLKVSQEMEKLKCTIKENAVDRNDNQVNKTVMKALL